MTISTTTSTITIAGNASTTVFSFPFVADSPSTMEVLYTDASGNTSTLSPSLYTLFINAPATGQLWGIGGTVTYPNTGSPPVPIAVGTFLTITRIVPLTQTVSISNQGAFYPQAVEQALDLLELQLQQVDESVSTFGPGNPTATAGPTAVIGVAPTFMRSDSAPAVQLGSSTQKGLLQVDGTTITASAGVISTVTIPHNPTATAGPTVVNGTATTFMRSDAAPAVQLGTSSQKGLVQVDGTTVTASSGVISVPTATTSNLGLVEPDGTTITISGGVITAPNAGAGNAVFSTTSGNTVGDIVTMRTTGTGVQDSGVALSSLPVLLLSQTASNSASLTLTSIPTGYKRYRMHLIDIAPATNASLLLLQVSEDNGSTYKTSSYTSFSTSIANATGTSTVTGSNSATGMVLAFNVVSPGIVTGTTEISNLALTGFQKSFFTTSVFPETASSGVVTSSGGGTYFGDTNAINALRVIAGSGNLTSGTVELWGYK